MRIEPGRPSGRLFFWWLILAAVILAGVQAQAVTSKTSIVDVLYRADGTPAQGTLLISWPAFTTAGGDAIAAGEMTIWLGPNGAVQTALFPNTGSTPQGSYYKVMVDLDDGTRSAEYWVVPEVQQTTIAAVRSSLVPQSQAMQFVGRDYVDSAIATALASVPAPANLASPGAIGGTTPGPVNATSYNVNGTPLASANLSDSASLTQQGNSFNGNSQLVQTDAGGHIPASTVPLLNQDTIGNAATATHAQNLPEDLAAQSSANPQAAAFTTVVANTGVTAQATTSGAVNAVLNPAICGVTGVSGFTPPAWCTGSDMGAWINAAAASCPSSGCTIEIPAAIYNFSTPIVLDLKLNITLRGQGYGYWGNGTGATTLMFTGTNSTGVLSIRGARSLRFENFNLRWNSAGVTGPLVNAQATTGTGGPNSAQTGGVTFEHVDLGPLSGASAAVWGSPAELVLLDGVYGVNFVDVTFKGAQYAVIGKLQNAPVPASNDWRGVANLVTFDRCVFGWQAIAPLRNGDVSWNITHTIFEPLYNTGGNGAAAAYVEDSGFTSAGLTFTNNWLGDEAAATGTWFSIQGGSNYDFRNNWISTNGQTTVLELNASVVSGLNFSDNTVIGAGGGTGVNFGATSGHSGVRILGNTWSNVTTALAGTLPSSGDCLYSNGSTLTACSINLPGTISATSLTASGTVNGANGVFGAAQSVNMLTAVEADFETGYTGWTNCTNASLATTTAAAAHGTQSLSITTTSGGAPTEVCIAASAGIPVTPGVTYYALASGRAATTGRVIMVGLTFRDGSGNSTGNCISGTSVSDTTTGWTQVSVNCAAPANSAVAQVVFYVAPSGTSYAATGEVHYLDTVSLSTSSSLVWVAPGVQNVTVANTSVVSSSDLTLSATGAVNVNSPVKLLSLPTSCSGQLTGTVWNNAGALGVCP